MHSAQRREQRRFAIRASGELLTPHLAATETNDRKIIEHKKAWPTVLAFLFAQPHHEAIDTLSRSMDYFNTRTGETWDLFFPGYYQKSENSRSFAEYDGTRFNRISHDWEFDSWGFLELSKHVAASSQDLWQYDGKSELVIVNAMLPMSGPPVIDWESLQSGGVDRDVTLALEQIIERISADLEKENEDPMYGVGEVLDANADRAEGFTTRVMIGAIGGMLAAFGKDALGL